MKKIYIENINSVFIDKNNDIFNNIKTFKLDESNKEYENIDILGEICLDIINCSEKKRMQTKKYIDLINNLNNNVELNKKFNFSEKNKKIILLVTNGRFIEFYKNFKDNGNYNKFTELKNSNIDHFFLYFKSKNDPDNILIQKLKNLYIYLLEKSSQNPEKISSEENELFSRLKKFNFSSLHEDFYKNIIIPNKQSQLCETLKKINSRYITDISSQYIYFLRRNVDYNNIAKIFVNNFKIESKNSEFLKKLLEEFTLKKDKISPELSIFELYTSTQIYEANKNYKLNDIECLSLSNDNLVDWYNNNKGRMTMKIIIYNINKNDLLLLSLSLFNIMKNKDIFQNVFYFFPVEFKEFLEKVLSKDNVIINKFFYDKVDDLKKKINDLKNEENLNYFLKSKISNRFIYFDKILKNRIIIDNNNKLQKNYIDNFLRKILQMTSIYINIDITKYKEEYFDIKNIKQSIDNNKNYFKEFIDYFIDKIKNDFKRQFLDENSLLYKLLSETHQNLDNYEKEMKQIYYKFHEKIYENYINEKIKDLIINSMIDNAKKLKKK